VVNVKLTDVYWLEVAVFTVVLLVDSIRVLLLVVDCTAPVPTGKVALCVSKFEVGRATDRAYPYPFSFVNLRKLVFHHDLVDKVRLLDFRRKSRWHLVRTKLTHNPQRTLRR